MFKQSTNEIYQSVDEFDQKYSDFRFRIQKVFSTAHFFVLTIYYSKVSLNLYIGRGANYQGLWFSKLKVDSSLRCNDRDREYIKSRLKNRVINKIISYKNYRSFSLVFLDMLYNFTYVNNKLCIIEFNISNDHCLVNSVSLGIKNKLIQVTPKIYIVNKYKEHILLNDCQSSIEDYYKNYTKILNNKFNSTKIKSSKKRKLQNIQKDISKIKYIISLKPLIISEKIDLSKDCIYFNKCKISLPKATHWAKRDFLFKKIKNLEIVLFKMEKRLKNQEEIDENTNEIEPTKSLQLKAINIQWKNLKHSKFLEYNVYGFQVYVGRNWSENIKLKSLVKVEDQWFHLKDYKGAHLYLVSDGKKVSDETMQILGSILIDYSNIKTASCSMIHTKVADIKFIKSGKGKVLNKNSTVTKINYINNWQEIITIL